MCFSACGFVHFSGEMVVMFQLRFVGFFDKRRTRQKKQVLLSKKQMEKVKEEEVGKAFVTKKWVHYGFYYFSFYFFFSGRFERFISNISEFFRGFLGSE